MLATKKLLTKLPPLGFGTWKLKGAILEQALQKALDVGYRLIDTAAYYENESTIGKILKQSGVPRQNLFITSKVWNTMRGYKGTLNACHSSLKKLKLDYLDLYLIHWPANLKQFNNAELLNQETWHALEVLYQKNLVKVIGVSNFLPHHLTSLFSSASIKPMVNQIELHPGFFPQTTVDFCHQHQILIETWSPLGGGALLNEPILLNLANKYRVSTAQICIRWATLQGFIPLPRSGNLKHIGDNIDLSFKLSAEEIKQLRNQPHGFATTLDPDEINF